jgi:imidazolonepropionase-like amidohydrolase
MFAVRGARLFDGLSGVQLRDPVVLIDAGRIVRVTELSAIASDALGVPDLGDVTLLPGLIDCHQHLVFDGSDDPVGHLAGRDDDAVLAVARGAAASALTAGVTTVRDLGDRDYVLVELRRELAADPTAGPELLVSGPPVTTPGGHCWFLGGESAGIDGVRAAVREHADRGVDVVKVMVTGGGLTPGSVLSASRRPPPGDRHASQYGPAELRAICDQAHSLGLPVTGHAQGALGIADAVDAGFDGIEHCAFLTAEGFSADPGVIGRMASAGTYVSMTAASKAPLERAIREPRFLAHAAEIVASLATMRAAGVRLAMSTDGGIIHQPHDALPWGVVRTSMIGMNSVEGLRTVTSTAAGACHVGDRKGRIAAGFDADVLAVHGDPLTDAVALTRVAAVYRAGVRVR